MDRVILQDEDGVDIGEHTPTVTEVKSNIRLVVDNRVYERVGRRDGVCVFRHLRS